MLQSNGSSEATVKGFRNSSISVDTVFPMGTKVVITNIDVDTVKNGVSLFSLRTGVPVLPMVILRRPKAFKKNYIIVGEPIFPDNERTKDKTYAEEFTRIIVDKMNELLHNGKERFLK